MDDNKTAVSTQLTELILSLEQATLVGKQLPANNDPTQRLQIYSFLYQANHHLSSFLHNTQLPPPTQHPLAENSLSSGTGAAGDENGSKPMEVGDDEEENNSKTSVDKVEDRMRDCCIKNKRAKRPLSPSSMAVAEEKRFYKEEFVGGVNGFDPCGTKLRALDLVCQFHG